MGAGPPLAPRSLLATVRRLGALFAREEDRWVLWLPALFGAGIAVYFSLPAEPPLWLGVAALAPVAAIGVAWRRHAAVLVTATALATVAAGFAAAQWRTANVAAPVLSEEIGPLSVTGRVVAIEALTPGVRVSLERPRITRLAPERTPERVRVRLGGEQPAIVPGDWIAVRAVLSPPPPPSAPGAFDFQRSAFFMGIGAVGFALGPARITAEAGARPFDSLVLAVARLRQALTKRVLESVDGPAGAVAAALITGERGTIPPNVMDAFRDSGLAHLLAISGLHVGLVAGIIFMGLRAGLALVPGLAVAHSIKKWAAAAAIAAAFAYTLVAGATVPTQRAFLMLSLVLVAVLFDRRGLSMRLVAWAALVILALAPESLLGASFQLSFAAVVALIATYEELRDWRRYSDAGPLPAWRRALLYVGGVALTTLIAGSVTAPFAVYHFNRFAAYGLAANLIAVPLTAVWIMPCAVVAFLLMPFGLEQFALIPMGWGTAGVIRVAEEVASWPGAASILPAMPAAGFGVMVVGGLWLLLWRRRWRLFGLAGIAAGLATTLLVRPPDVMIDGDGRLLAVRTADGILALSSRRAARFEREVWLRLAGQGEEAAPWPEHGSSADGRMRCDALGCVYRLAGRTVSLVMRAEALAEDCWTSEVIVALVPVRAPCPRARAVVDRFDLWRDGGHALWIDETGVRIESVNAARGDRPWVLKR